jgi:hypothetical protein
VSPLRARKSVGGKWFRVNFTLRSVVDFLRDWLPDGHVQPGRRPWSSITIGPRGWSYNTKRRTGRVDLPGPFSYETPRIGDDVERWTDDRGLRFERVVNATGGTTTSYLPDPVSDDDAEQQSCPRCHAEPTAPCRTRGTGRPTKPHMPRVELARFARAYPDPAAEPHGGEIPPWGTPPR